MNQKKGIIKLTAAALSALMLPFGMLSSAAAETQSDYDSDFVNWKYGCMFDHELRDYVGIVERFGIQNCNYDGTGAGAEVSDFYALESAINQLCRENNYVSIVADANTTKYDINKDSHVTPEDYCLLLEYVQQGFTYELIGGDELYAKITGYNGNAEHLEVPREIYAKGRIFPVMEIADNAFAGNTRLKSIRFRNYVQPDWHICGRNDVQIPTAGQVTASTSLTFGSHVFDGCSNLDTLTLPQHTCFADTALFENVPKLKEKYVEDNDGIIYFRDPDENNDTVIAFDMTGDQYYTAQESHSVSFADDTTSINLTMTWKLPYDTIYTVNIPDSVTFIQDWSFLEFKKLSTVNGGTFRQNSPEMQKLIRRYLSAFDSTLFTEQETMRTVEELNRLIREKCDPEQDPTTAAVLAGRLIAQRAEYSDYFSLVKPNGNAAPGADNVLYYSDGFELYLNQEYYYNDLLRNTTYSATAVYMLADGEHEAYTDCVGFALASSLLLDRLGIENYYCGAPNHALNIVRINGVWSVFDMAGNSQEKPINLTAERLLGGICKEMTVSSNNKFEMFPYSANRQLTEDVTAEILNPVGSHPETLLLKASGKGSKKDRALLSKEGVSCDFPK